MSAVVSAVKTVEWQNERDALVAAIWRAHETWSPLIMGIVNTTPDSFSDGGEHYAPDDAIRHARQLADEGATLLDIGGESTRPGADFVSVETELMRTLPVLRALSAGSVSLSIDTYKASVACEAIGAGAIMVNDVWGMKRDPAMADTLARSGAVSVLMHNREKIDPSLNMLDEFRCCFDAILRQAEKAGICRERIVLDPGIGFGKTDPQNLESIRLIGALREAYGLPIMLGLSRKSLIGRLLGRGVDDRLSGTLAANLCGMQQGAALLRVHDVAPHVDAVKMALLLNGPATLSTSKVGR